MHRFSIYLFLLFSQVYSLGQEYSLLLVHPTKGSSSGPSGSLVLENTIQNKIGVEGVLSKVDPGVYRFVVTELGDIGTLESLKDANILGAANATNTCDSPGYLGDPILVEENVEITDFRFEINEKGLATESSQYYFPGRAAALVKTDGSCPKQITEVPVIAGIIAFTKTIDKKVKPKTPIVNTMAASNMTVAYIRSYSKSSNSTGYVEFIASKNNTQIEVNVDIIGMKPNTNYSFAITTYGELRGKGLKNVGMHFNPNNKTHGCLPSNERHAGDLGIGLSDEKGFLNLNFTADSVVLNSISYNGILGRAAVIYEGNFCNSTSKNATTSSPISAGVIGFSAKRLSTVRKANMATQKKNITNESSVLKTGAITALIIILTIIVSI